MGRAMAKGPDRRRAGVPDAHLWHAVAESTRPLKGKRRPAVSADDSLIADAPSIKPAKKAARMKPAPVLRQHPARIPAASALHPGQTAGVDRATAQRFKRGEMPIEASLDLHGMTQDSAHSALVGFIKRARAAGRRCVLVITGKGERAGADGAPTGVLRANVPRWLNEPGLKASVLAIAHARPRQGGTGALYVLLKRVREEGAR